MNISRRNFLKYSTLLALGATAEFSPFGMLSKVARAATGYQALVCIFMAGGNDGNNTLIPNTGDPVLAPNTYANYNAIRTNIAIPQNQLVALTSGTAQAQSYGLHPNLSDVAALYNAGSVAILTNVGPLAQPTTVTDYKGQSVPLPESLFSHRDQQIEWQNGSGLSVGSAAGWGGLLADAVQSMNNGAAWPTLTTFSGITVFCNGNVSTPGALAATSGTLATALNCSESGSVCISRKAGIESLLGTSLTEAQLALIEGNDAIGNLAFSDNAALGVALAKQASISTPLPANPNGQTGTNGLATSLRNVAQMMSVANQLNITRQIFFVQAPGQFDTHSAQTFATGGFGSQDQSLKILNDGMKYFHTVLTADATFPNTFWPNVTVCTISDFARTFQSNTAAGTDHAWGNHHFIMGGAVKGGQFYGTMPTLELNGPDDADGQGRWVPTTSVAQYGATLAQWFGVTDSTSLNTIFPALPNFSTTNLGFV